MQTALSSTRHAPSPRASIIAAQEDQKATAEFKAGINAAKFMTQRMARLNASTASDMPRFRLVQPAYHAAIIKDMRQLLNAALDERGSAVVRDLTAAGYSSRCANRFYETAMGDTL